MASLAERITRAFPEIGQVEPLREVGLGARSRVVETAGGIAVKMGRVPAAASAYENEWRALPVLARHLSTAIPAPRWRALSGEPFQHGALAYPMLRGLADAAIAAYRKVGGRYDNTIAHRVGRYWQSRVLGGLAFSIEFEDEDEVLDQIRKVREIFFGA